MDLTPLSPATTRRFLDHTGLSPDAPLSALYSSFVSLCRYDTIPKALAHDLLPGGDPEESMEWILSTPCGLTCMAGARALHALLTTLGFSASLVGCSLEADPASLAPGAAASLLPGVVAHLGLRVESDEGPLWLDTAVDHARPLLLNGDGPAGACEARTSPTHFTRRSMTSEAFLSYRFEEDISSQERLRQVIDATRATLDATWPLYAVQRGSSPWAVRGGPSEITGRQGASRSRWEALQVGVSSWEEVSSERALFLLGVEGSLARRVLERALHPQGE